MHIRPALIEELRDLYAVRAVALELKETPQSTISLSRIHEHFNAYGRDNLEEEWNKPNTRFWVAENETQDHPQAPFTIKERYMIGMYSHRQDYQNLVIDNLYALPTRHYGGRQMMTHSICIAQKIGCTAIEVDARYKNSVAWYKNVALFDFALQEDVRTGLGTMVLYRENFKKSLKNIGLIDRAVLENL
jgi:hypothetical protein